jgi:hypothetical protein
MVSATSPTGVEVPCALRYRPVGIEAGVLDRRLHAARGAFAVSLGAVMWYASELMPKPTSSQ